MDLRGYLNQHNLSLGDFAKTIEVSTEAVRLYVAGKRIPRAEIMRRIEAETGGHVQPNDFYGKAAA